MRVTGKCSWFGGPDDDGVSPDEGLAFIYDVDDQPDLFLSEQPPGTSGLARRLDPEEFYVACRWPYDSETKAIWREALLARKALVLSIRTGKKAWAFPADWGPHGDTDRVADLSPSLLSFLELETDDDVEVLFPTRRVTLPAEPEEGEAPKGLPYPSIVMSSGHSTKCQGAIGILNEVEEATRVVDRVAELLADRGVDITTFHDTISTSQNENLNRIVDFHNAQSRQLDVSVHFNANVETDSPMGTECLFVSQDELAADVANAIATNGLKDRGPKYRNDLFFLNNTNEPAILIEVCFVDSSADAEIYQATFEEICTSIANVLSGEEPLVA